MRESRRMRALRAILLAVALVMVLPAGAALAQVSVDPSVTPELNTGGWVHGMAILFGVIGLLVILLLVAGLCPVRAAILHRRVDAQGGSRRPGTARRGASASDGGHQGRRPMVVVAPPPLPQPAGVAAAATPAVAAAPAPRAPAPAQAGPGAEAPSTEAPQAAPAGEGAPAGAGAAADARGNTCAPRRRRPRPPPPSGPRSRSTRRSSTRRLKELLEKGTDKRVAEGQARRAAMIAARKKAAGEA